MNCVYTVCVLSRSLTGRRHTLLLDVFVTFDALFHYKQLEFSFLCRLFLLNYFFKDYFSPIMGTRQHFDNTFWLRASIWFALFTWLTCCCFWEPGNISQVSWPCRHDNCWWRGWWFRNWFRSRVHWFHRQWFRWATCWHVRCFDTC